MALVESSMMALGTAAPSFTLPDTLSGENLSLSDLRSETATVVMFICNHCPYVVHVNPRLSELAREYKAKGIQFIAISSNNVETHPQDGPEYMKLLAEKMGYTFPYLYDATQEVAKAYGAECTPDFFVFDRELKCAYRGRFDDSRPGMGEASGIELSRALDALISGSSPSSQQMPSIGCNIKWK